MIFLIEKPEIKELAEASNTLAEKLSKAKDGDAIQLTTNEKALYHTASIIGLDNKPTNLFEIDPSKNYLLFCDPNRVCIDDVVDTSNRLNVNIGIVRCLDSQKG
jgi:hypothetical protein